MAPSLPTRPASVHASPSGATADLTTLVSFTVGDDLLAAPVETVERVLRWVQPASLPQLPDWLEGVIPHGGRMVPVVDLRRRFGRENDAVTSATRIIVFNAGADWLGAVVDAVLEVITVDATTIDAPPPVVRGLSGQYLLGLTKRDERVVLVLDAARLLTATEQLALHALDDDAGVST
jgi:purine-binding chemotaxis protein CheW